MSISQFHMAERKIIHKLIHFTNEKGELHTSPFIGVAFVFSDGKKIYREYPVHFSGQIQIDSFNNIDSIVLTMEPSPNSSLSDFIKKLTGKKVWVLSPYFHPNESMKTLRAWKSAGVEVIYQPIEEAVEINDTQYKYYHTGLPLIVASWGMSIDGKIATKTGDSKYISNGDSLHHVHQVRNKMKGIMVGIGTVLKDNPQLTTRLPEGNHADRFILDSHLKTPLSANIVELAHRRIGKTTIFYHLDNKEKRKELESRNVEVIQIKSINGVLDLHSVFQEISKRQVQSVLVEGGARLLGALYDNDLIDKIHCYISPVLIGGKQAISPLEGEGIHKLCEATSLVRVKSFNLGNDLVIQGYVSGHEPFKFIKGS